MIIVSGCLAGMKCRYNGLDSKKEEIVKLIEEGKAIPLCPEVLGGLTTPRTPCEQVKINGELRIIGKDGNDYTNEFSLGAKYILSICKALNIDKAILIEKSPSCGVKNVYDGTFSNKLVNGSGITTKLLQENGISVISYQEYLELVEKD